MTTEWDAAIYDRISDPQVRWGADVLDRLPLEGDEAAVMLPGARLVAQCGGEGNIARVMEAAREAGDDWGGPVTFESTESTRGRLEVVGFEDVDVWIHEEPTSFEAGEPFETFQATVVPERDSR